MYSRHMCPRPKPHRPKVRSKLTGTGQMTIYGQLGFVARRDDGLSLPAATRSTTIAGHLTIYRYFETPPCRSNQVRKPSPVDSAQHHLTLALGMHQQARPVRKRQKMKLILTAALAVAPMALAPLLAKGNDNAKRLNEAAAVFSEVMD